MAQSVIPGKLEQDVTGAEERAYVLTRFYKENLPHLNNAVIKDKLDQIRRDLIFKRTDCSDHLQRMIYFGDLLEEYTNPEKGTIISAYTELVLETYLSGISEKIQTKKKTERRNFIRQKRQELAHLISS